MKTLERRLGLVSVIAISLGAMLGSGLFVLPGLASALTGPSVWLAYLVAGLAVLPAALSKSELATAMPTSGGTYVYIDRTFGPLAGTIAGLGLWLSLLLKSSFALVGFGAYLFVIVSVPLKPTALVLLVAIVALNILGVRKVGKIQVVVVGFSLVGLGVISLFAVGQFHPEYLEPSLTHGASGFLAAVSFVYISYAGVTKVAAIAEEVSNPGRNLPLGILVSLCIAGVLYTVVTLLLVGNIPVAELHDDLHPIFTLAQRVGGTALGLGAAGLGVITMTSMANAGLLATSRFPFAMSRDKLLPPFLSRVHRRYLTPVSSILVTGLFMGVAILTLEIQGIAKLASSFMILAFIGENLAVVFLRETSPQWYKPTYQAPLYPVMQAAGVLVGIVLLVMLGWLAAVAIVGVAVPGAVLYFLHGRKRVTRIGVVGALGPRQQLIVEGRAQAEAPDYRADVVVALLGGETSPETLVEVAGHLGEERKVEVVHYTDVPEQVALDSMLEEDPVVTALRRRVHGLAAREGFEVDFDAIVTRDVVQSVHDVQVRSNCDWLVLQWRRRAERGVFLVNPLGWLMNHLSCNLAVFKDAGVRSFKELLVWPKPGPHDALVVTTADHLAEVWDAGLTLVRHVPEDAPAIEGQREADYLDQLAQLCVRPTTTRICRGVHEVTAIADLSAGFDLLVMGAPQDTRLRDYFVGTREDRLTARAPVSVLRLKTPRVQTHAAIPSDSPERDALRPGALLDPRAVAVNLEVKQKSGLFSRLATAFAQVVPKTTAKQIEEALWARERTQNTAVGHGVAMPHATIAEAERTVLGVFVLSEPLEYGAGDGQPVEFVFATVGPPSDRHTHLLLLASLSQHVLGSRLLDELRAAGSVEEIARAFEALDPA